MSSRASSLHSDPQSETLSLPSSIQGDQPAKTASRPSSVHSDRSLKMAIFTHDPWRPGGARVYTDEERLEGEKIKSWIRSTTKNEHSSYTRAKPKDVAHKAETAKKVSKLELEGQYQYLQDYLDPALIVTGFFKLDICAVREIWNLEKQAREAATEAKEDESLKIKVVDEHLLGPDHSIWGEMDEAAIQKMTESEKKYYHWLTIREIIFLRTKATELQRLMYEREAALESGETLEEIMYRGVPRPVDVDTLVN